MTSLPASLIFGFLNDWKLNVKTIVLFGNILQINGSFMYLIRVEMVVFPARCIVGIGASNVGLLMGDVNRVTKDSHKTSVISAILVFFTCGLFLGPAFNFFMTRFNLTIGTLVVDVYTAPGLIMGIIWIFYQFLMVFTYYDPDEIGVDEEVDQRGKEIRPLLEKSNPDDAPDRAATMEEPLEGSRPSYEVADQTETAAQIFQRYYDEFIKDSVLVCLSIVFLTMFMQTNSETISTPLLESFFHFGTFENSLFFGVLGVTGFVLCVVVSILGSKGVEDRKLVFVGLVFMTLSILLSLIVFSQGHFGQKNLMGYFFAIILVYLIGHSLLYLVVFSMYSKLISNQSMGFAMGLKRAVDILGMMMGPLWAGPLVNRLYLLYGVNLGLSILVFALFIFTYPKMVRE